MVTGFPAPGACTKLRLADVDADMIDLAAVDLEEHEIAGFEFARFHRVGLLRLFARSPRHGESELPVRVEDEAAAVETIARRATVAVTRATQS